MIKAQHSDQQNFIHAVEGRNEEALRPFLKLLSKKAKRLRGVGIDMSAAYASSVNKHLPTVPIIFDRFHVTKLLNNAIDKIRRSEYAKCQNKGLHVFKGQRFLLLRNFVDLGDEQKSSLQHLLDVNKSLAIAHSMSNLGCFGSVIQKLKEQDFFVGGLYKLVNQLWSS